MLLEENSVFLDFKAIFDYKFFWRTFSLVRKDLKIKEVVMFRKVTYTTLLVLLALSVAFVSSSCEKLKVNKLQANFYFSKANHQFSDGRFRLAIEEYERALEYNPELIEAYRFLGESYKSLYKPTVEDERNLEIAQKAIDALNKALEIEPENKELIHSLGDMYDKMRDFEEAEKLYLMILDMEPTNMSNYYVVAEFYKRYSGGSEEDAEKVEGKTPFEKAEEMYLRRIELDPENEQGYSYIAQFYGGLTPLPDWDMANYYHEKRIALNPESAEAWLWKGVNHWSKAYRYQSKLTRQQRINLSQESEQALKKANELDEQYPEPYSWLSVLYRSVLAKLFPDRAKRYEEEADRYIQKFQDLRKRQAARERLADELREVR